MNEDFEKEFDKALDKVLSLNDEELQKLPDSPIFEKIFETFEKMNDAYLESLL